MTGVFPREQGRASIASLPYIAGRHDPETGRTGVQTWNRDLAWSGVNLFNATLQREVQLLGMQGDVLHRWRYPGGATLLLAVPLSEGHLIGLEEEVAVFRLDQKGKELWRYPAKAHHAIELDDRGHIWTLTRDNRTTAYADDGSLVIEDFIVELTPEGRVVQRISILEILERSPFAGLIPSFLIGEARPREDGPRAFDLVHPNHVEVFEGALAGESLLYKRGNMLVSLRNMNAIAIIDGSSHDVVWLWGPGYLFAQHHPTLLTSGNILLFDNGVDRSTIVEVDPRTNRIVWEYRIPRELHSRRMGSCQRLANGNTLVTSSEAGYVLEVTPDREIVWMFANPERDGDLRMSVYRFTRHPSAELAFLGQTP